MPPPSAGARSQLGCRVQWGVLPAVTATTVTAHAETRRRTHRTEVRQLTTMKHL
jgi:hypothetical protein